MPPMGGDAPGGDPMMGGEEPPMGPDAEGEPDEEGGAGSDVKKYSGELSQALNTYNEENPNDEEKLNKYAANMIAAQVANYLSDKDKRKVIKKLQGEDDEGDDGMSSDEQPQPQPEEEPMPQMENRIIKEITDELINGRKPAKRKEKYRTNKKVTDHSPFVFDGI